MTRLILIRHGETKINTQGKIHKYSDSEQLTQNGISQIEKTAEALKEYDPTSIYCSLENRAIQSAEIISMKLNIPLLKTDGLRERNWGDYGGLTFQEIKQKSGMDKMSFEERYNFHPPRGESWKETEERLLKALYQVLSENKNKTIILLTHGGSIRTYMPTLLGVNKEESYKYDPDNASISIFDYDGSSFKKIIYNNINHLNKHE